MDFKGFTFGIPKEIMINERRVLGDAAETLAKVNDLLNYPAL